MSDVTVERYPGESIGLPEKGPGSLATWRARIGAMIGDWAASMIVAIGLFGMDVMTGSGWKSFMIMAVYFVEASVLTALTGASFGQLIARIGIVRLDGGPLGWWRPFTRTLLLCLVIPAVIWDKDQRGMHDRLSSTVLVRR